MIIIHQLCELAISTTVVCDDTDIFILLVHHYAVHQMTATVIMEGTGQERKVIDIGECSNSLLTASYDWY